MQARISIITLGVADLARSYRFYAEGLGLPTTRDPADEVLAAASGAGAEILKRADDTEWGGYSGYFADPDGHVWEVAWGAFPFNDDGSLAVG